MYHISMNQGKYIFTEDWFSINIPTWETLLSRFRGLAVNALEIGSYQGRSAVWLLENILTHNDSTLTCVDTFEGSAEHTNEQKSHIWNLFQHNVLNNFGSKVRVLRGMSGKVVRAIDPQEVYDIVYIDGAHYSANAMEDAVLTFPLLKKGGIMIFDDYRGGNPGEMEMPHNAHTGINGFLAAYSPFIRVVYTGYQVFIEKIGSV